VGIASHGALHEQFSLCIELQIKCRAAHECHSMHSHTDTYTHYCRHRHRRRKHDKMADKNRCHIVVADCCAVSSCSAFYVTLTFPNVRGILRGHKNNNKQKPSAETTIQYTGRQNFGRTGAKTRAAVMTAFGLTLPSTRITHEILTKSYPLFYDSKLDGEIIELFEDD